MSADYETLVNHASNIKPKRNSYFISKHLQGLVGEIVWNDLVRNIRTYVGWIVRLNLLQYLLIIDGSRYVIECRLNCLILQNNVE